MGEGDGVNNSFLEKARGLEVSSFTLLFLGGAPQTPFLGLADGISCAQAGDCVRCARAQKQNAGDCVRGVWCKPLSAGFPWLRL